ncbi:MAG: peroxiredoxin family protein [Planctomycetaceae bacterium]|nr:peroxiredoxin family protein [Planctomycetaceae bacterium]
MTVAGLLWASAVAWADDPPIAKEGEKAPDFKLKGTDGKEYTLKQFAGKQAVVIAWFPKAKTGGCTAECMSMRDHGDEIRKFDVAYFTASCDKPEFNKEFADELKLDFPILSDPEKTTAKAYGVVHKDREVPERWTFFIDKDGVIKHIEKKVSTKTHGEDVAKKLAELGIEKKK